MKLQDVTGLVAGIPHMTTGQGRVIYDHVMKTKPARILELGFANGVSSCYMAAALDELGGDGHITTIDNQNALTRTPPITELLDRCKLAHRATPVFDETSYTWELARMLRQSPLPRFDFVFIDGAHQWDPDGFAFLLADRMLNPGGWVLFDDLDWTLGSSPTLKSQQWVLDLPEEQRTTPQVRMVFELLVKTHPGYTGFREKDGWAWARKKDDGRWPFRRR